MSGARGRVLVVDDDGLNRMILSATLEELGFEVETAEDGREALERLARPDGAPLDAVLLDMVMPELDGFGVLSALRGNGHPPVIAVSGLEEEDDAARCLAAGAAGFLRKPVDPAALAERLDGAASRRLSTGSGPA